eukprot:evm.model.scf_59.11 EVM.evm.TU.scf_59.11   scf_59:72827-73118(-)
MGGATPQEHILNAEAMLVSGLYREAAEEAGCVFGCDPALVSKHQRLRAYAVRMASLYEDQRRLEGGGRGRLTGCGF